MKIHGYKGETEQKPGQEFKDTIQVSGIAYIVDGLCEGKIKGLVTGKGSIYFDEVPMEYEDGSTDFNVPHNFFQENAHFLKGENGVVQDVLPPPFRKINITIPTSSSTEIKKSRTMSVTFNSNTYPNVTEAIVNLRFPSLFRQWDDPSIESATTYSTYTDSWTRSRIQSLQNGRNAGDVTKTPVHLKIYLSHNYGSFYEISDIKIEHKSSSGFIISRRVTLPIDNNQAIQYYILKVERLTDDAQSLKVNDKTFLDSVIVQIDSQFKYPNTVVCGLKLDAEKFPSLPDRRYLCDLLEVKIPSNYTPAVYDGNGNLVQGPYYTGNWDGTFLTAWTNNPAWIWYDLVTNKRYGLGEFIDANQVDKWTLYAIGQYCDAVDETGAFQGVDDGKGGVEQRFTCNCLLSSTEEAYTVINNLASVFRGITYWMSGLIFPVQDRFKQPVQLFTNSNVIDGIFDYSTTEKNNIRTVALVRWNDPDDFYKPKVEYVEDVESILKYGIREAEMAAFACTSRGQAMRVGKWTLLTEKLEREVVRFRTGLDGLYSRPGDVIEIYDDFSLQQTFGGRVQSMPNSTTVRLDREVTLNYSPSAYQLTLSIPKANKDPSRTGDPVHGVTNSTGISEIRVSQTEKLPVTGASLVSGAYTELYVSGGYSQLLSDNVWSLEVTNPSNNEITGAQQFRILSITENDDHQLDILALEYNSGKFAASEENFTSRVAPKINYQLFGIFPPTSLSLTLENKVDGSDFSFYIHGSWTKSIGPQLAYHIASGRRYGEVQEDWRDLPVDDEDDNNFDWTIFARDIYQVRVLAVQKGGSYSIALTGQINAVGTSPFGTGAEAVVPLTGINLLNAEAGTPTIYADREPQFNFVMAPTGQNFEDDRFGTLNGVRFQLWSGAYSGVGSGIPITRQYEVDEEEALQIPYNGILNGGEIVTGWPMRTFSISAKTYDYWNNESETIWATFQNPAMVSGGAIDFLTKDKNSFRYVITPGSAVNDLSGVKFWINALDNRPLSVFTIEPTLVGEVVHNLNVDDVYVWYEVVDNFLERDNPIMGSFTYNHGDFSFPSGWTFSGTLEHEFDSRMNKHYHIKFEWDRISGNDIGGYQLEVKNDLTTAEDHNFNIAQPRANEEPRYLFRPTVGGAPHSGRVRIYGLDGRSSDWSPYCSPIEPPYTHYEQWVTHNLFVDGGANNKVYNVNINNVSSTLEMGNGDILGLNLTNNLSINLEPVNIRSGASYLMLLHRDSGTGNLNWGSGFKWPDGEAPNTPTGAGEEMVIACFATGINAVYGVASYSFS